MPKSFLSIGTKLIFLVLAISLVSIAVTTALAFNLTDSILKTSVEQTLSDESQERGSLVSSIIKQRATEIESLASNSVIQNFLQETPAGLDDVTYNRYLDEEMENIEEQIKLFQLNQFSSALHDLQVINSQGRKIFSLNENSSSKRIPVSQIQIEKTKIEFVQGQNKERLLMISVPIKTQEGSRQLGIITAITPTSVFDSVLLNRFGLQETGEVYLVNKDRVMISESIFVEGAAFNQKVDSEPVNMCFGSGQSVNGMTYNDYRGVEIFGVSYCEQDLGFVLLTEVDERVVLEPIYELQERIMVLGASIMVAASIATFVLSKRISNPILKLQNASNEISKGNFDVRTRIQTNDEIGQLSSSFDSMADAIQETVSAITKRENIIKQQEHILMKYSEEKQECCVCLVDIVGSNIIKGTLSEEKSRQYYDSFIKHVSEIVEKHNGVTVKVVDDSLLFYFPLEKSKATHENAIACCLEVAESHQTLNERFKSSDLPGIAYRISATAGVVNITKSTSSLLQDIFGEPVNHCFKINQYALPNTLVVGESLYEKTKEKEGFRFTKIDQSLIKGLEYTIFIVSKN